jgi:hypothetical protein
MSQELLLLGKKPSKKKEHVTVVLFSFHSSLINKRKCLRTFTLVEEQSPKRACCSLKQKMRTLFHFSFILLKPEI